MKRLVYDFQNVYNYLIQSTLGLEELLKFSPPLLQIFDSMSSNLNIINSMTKIHMSIHGVEERNEGGRQK